MQVLNVLFVQQHYIALIIVCSIVLLLCCSFFFSLFHTCSLLTCDSWFDEVSLSFSNHKWRPFTIPYMLACVEFSNNSLHIYRAFGGLCIQHQLKNHRKTFQFTIFGSFSPSFRSLALAFQFHFHFSRLLLLTLSHQNISIRRNSVGTTLQPIRLDNRQWGGSNVQSLFSVRLFLYHFIYLKLLWLVFIDADAAAPAAAIAVLVVTVVLCHTPATRNVLLLYRHKHAETHIYQFISL